MISYDDRIKGTFVCPNLHYVDTETLKVGTTLECPDCGLEGEVVARIKDKSSLEINRKMRECECSLFVPWDGITR
jgi:hypothetical protein